MSQKLYHELTGNRDRDVLHTQRKCADLHHGAVSKLWQAKQELASLVADMDIHDKIQLECLLDMVLARTRVSAGNDKSQCRRRLFHPRRQKMAQAMVLRQAEGHSTSFDSRKTYYGQRHHPTRGYLGEHSRVHRRKLPKSIVLYGNGKFRTKSNRSSYKSTPTSSLAKAFSYSKLVAMVVEVSSRGCGGSSPRSRGACIVRDCVCVCVCFPRPVPFQQAVLVWAAHKGHP